MRCVQGEAILTGPFVCDISAIESVFWRNMTWMQWGTNGIQYCVIVLGKIFREFYAHNSEESAIYNYYGYKWSLYGDCDDFMMHCGRVSWAVVHACVRNVPMHWWNQQKR